ncbi:MAG: HEAT repeat domain-containing protein [Chloroflexota bacterium]
MVSPPSIPIEEIITELADSGKPLVNARLSQLSNLSPAGLGQLAPAWPGIETERRRRIVSRMVELAEDNVVLDFDGIFKLCLRDKDAAVRGLAIEGLWENEEPSLINPLIDRLEHDGAESIQAAAARGLGKFALLAECGQLRSAHATRVRQVLLATVNDTQRPDEVRRRALEAVAPYSQPRVKQAILDFYRSQNPKFQASALYAMGRNCDASWLPVLLKELANSDAEIRYEAATACGELGEEEAVPHLARLTDDPDIDVRLAAIQALGKVGGDQARASLEKQRDDTSRAVQQAAEEALGEMEAMGNPLSFHIT